MSYPYYSYSSDFEPSPDLPFPGVDSPRLVAKLGFVDDLVPVRFFYSEVPPWVVADDWDGDDDDWYSTAEKIAQDEKARRERVSRCNVLRHLPYRGGFDDESIRSGYGLVYSHITGRCTEIERQFAHLSRELAARGLYDAHVTVSADVVEVEIERDFGNHAGGGIRGKVFGMSRQSRKRMLKRMAKVRGLEDAWFLTLTYPDVFPEDWQTWKRHLKAFIKRLNRACEKWEVTASGIWRLEVVIRKSGEVNEGKPAPHFHLVVQGLAGSVDIDFFRAWLLRAWYEVVGSDDLDHLKAGTQCDEVEDRRHAMRYVSKYIAKEDDEVAVLFALKALRTGRVWGQFGELDTEPYCEFYLPATAVPAFRRIVAGWLRSRGQSRYANAVKRRVTGFFVLGLGSDSQDWIPPPGAEEIMSTIDKMIDYVFDEAFAYERELRGQCESSA